MAVRILTDSTADVPPDAAKEFGITIVPLYVHFGEEAYLDGVEITTDEFYRKLKEGKAFPITAAPSPQTLADYYDRLAGENDEVLAIVLSSKLSATYDSALKGRELCKSGSRVEIVDSLWATLGLGVLVIATARRAKEGASLDELVAFARDDLKRVELRVAFDTLEYLRRGGRIGRAQALMGSMLKVNPILTIKDGLVDGIGRTRSREKAMDYLVEFTSSFPKISELLVGDATTPDEAELLVNRLSDIYPRERIYRTKVGAVVGAHVGPHVLGVAILPGT